MTLGDLNQTASTVLILNADHSWSLIPAGDVEWRRLADAQVVIGMSKHETKVLKNRFGPTSK